MLPKLLEWSRFNSVEYDEIVSKELQKGKGADLRSSERYWKQVMSLVVEARFEATRALLRLHSQADSKPFLEADALLRGIPVYTVSSILIYINTIKIWHKVSNIKLIKCIIIKTLKQCHLITLCKVQLRPWHKLGPK